ncbi:MAG: hydroxyacylglutathione hydrolase [Halothiobacillaceae bacterium]
MRITPLPAFDDNYIWLLHDGTDTAVVDPGDARPVIDYLDGQSLHLNAILLTHHHGDHTGGARELAERYGAVIFGPPSERIDDIRRPLEDGETVDLGQLGQWQVMATPGHTLDHIAYYSQEAGALFCGDTLFGAGCGRLFEGTPRQMQNTLEKIRALPDDTLIYCGHEYTEDNLRFAVLAEPGNQAIRDRIETTRAQRERGEPTVPSTLRLEKATNPFLRWDSPELRRRVAERSGQDIAKPDAMFAAIRAWKDAFDAKVA